MRTGPLISVWRRDIDPTFLSIMRSFWLKSERLQHIRRSHGSSYSGSSYHHQQKDK